MISKKLGFLVAGLFLLGACTSAQVENADSSGGGAQSSESSQSSSGAAPRSGLTITEGSTRDFVINVGDRIFFDFDQSSIRADARPRLEAQAAWLKKFPAVQVTIEGHADERGTREYNLALGERRANSTKDFLVALGINPNRIRVISFGKERPVALGHNEEAWQQNRRAVTVVTTGATGS